MKLEHYQDILWRLLVHNDFGGFFVSINVLDQKTLPVKMFKQEIPIPIANGFVIIGEGEEGLAFNAQNFELVTIHTISEIISNIADAMNVSAEVFEIVTIENESKIKL